MFATTTILNKIRQPLLRSSQIIIVNNKLNHSRATTTIFTSRQMSSGSKQYKNPSLTTDAIVLKMKKKEISDQNNTASLDTLSNFDLLLIKRKNDPYKDHFAFPGGFVEYGEDPEKGVLRELKEETNLTGDQTVHLIAVQGDPNRDPRRHTVTIAYAVKVNHENLSELQFGDDAADAGFYPLDQVLDNKENQFALAFDHREILNKYMTWLKEKGKSILFNY